MIAYNSTTNVASFLVVSGTGATNTVQLEAFSSVDIPGVRVGGVDYLDGVNFSGSVIQLDGGQWVVQSRSPAEYFMQGVYLGISMAAVLVVVWALRKGIRAGSGWGVFNGND